MRGGSFGFGLPLNGIFFAALRLGATTKSGWILCEDAKRLIGAKMAAKQCSRNLPMVKAGLIRIRSLTYLRVRAEIETQRHREQGVRSKQRLCVLCASVFQCF